MKPKPIPIVAADFHSAHQVRLLMNENARLQKAIQVALEIVQEHSETLPVRDRLALERVLGAALETPE